MDEKVSVDQAFALIAKHVGPSPAETIKLDARAIGRITGEPVFAEADTPRRDCSAMDGFALCSMDSLSASQDEPLRLAIGQPISAEAELQILTRGDALPISTGAAIPEGADTVIVKERARVEDGVLVLNEAVRAGQNIRSRGEDALKGQMILGPGASLGPDAIGALLAFGVRGLAARQPPSIRLLPTGSELSDPSASDREARVDCNGPMIGAMCSAMGLEYSLSKPLPDCADRIAAAVAGSVSPSGREIIVATGGVSAGTRDLVRSAVEKLGAQIIFHGVAMRPGKPLLFALLPGGRPFFGLPGNPVAALVGFRFFVWAAIRRSMGLPIEAGRPVSALVPGRAGTSLFLRARHDPAMPGCVDVDLDQRSHILSSMIAANAWLRVDGVGGESKAWLFPKHPSMIADTPAQPCGAEPASQALSDS